MRQTILCVPLEVKPESCSRLSELIDQLKQREDKSENPLAPNFERLIRLVPSLHFMSMSVFPGAEYDPLFILEANFDGPPGPFWGQLESVIGECLRAIVRCWTMRCHLRPGPYVGCGGREALTGSKPRCEPEITRSRRGRQSLGDADGNQHLM